MALGFRDRICGIVGSFSNIPKAILYLLERDMGHWSAGRRHLQSQRQVRQGEVFLHPEKCPGRD